MREMRPMWRGLEAYLERLPETLPEPPRAILIVSGHWEAPAFTVTVGEAHPGLLYDYYGFPPNTYQIQWPAPGAPWLAERTESLLSEAGLPTARETLRGFDHGVFVPLAVAWPEANVPVVQLSLHHSLDPALHLAAGRALAPLRDEGVLVLGSGMSFHNLRAYGNPGVTAPAAEFDRWLVDAAAHGGGGRSDLLSHWQQAPYAQLCHPRSEHLLPMMVAAGASEEPGTHDFGEEVLAAAVSGFRFA
ncbi:DODA-type extradiol aromatic ring-opening family dioxygenase [Croceibacterium salegens]